MISSLKYRVQRARTAKNSEIQLLFSIGYGPSLDCTIIVYSIVVGSQKVVGPCKSNVIIFYNLTSKKAPQFFTRGKGSRCILIEVSTRLNK